MKPLQKKRKLPSLDESFEARRESDFPALHQGRTRKQAHVVGQWAAHVYLELLPSAVLRKILDEAIDLIESATAETVHSLLALSNLTPATLTPTDTTSPSSSVDEDFDKRTKARTKGNTNRSKSERLPLHLSLSRPLLLQTAQRESLRVAVRKVASELNGFEGSYAQFSVLENDETTRRFLSIEVGFGFAQMKEIVDTLDPHLQLLRLPSYYESPRFHSSIAWVTLPVASSGGGIPFDESTLAKLEERFGKRLREEKIWVGELVCKIGKEVQRFPFA